MSRSISILLFWGSLVGLQGCQEHHTPMKDVQLLNCPKWGVSRATQPSKSLQLRECWYPGSLSKPSNLWALKVAEYFGLAVLSEIMEITHLKHSNNRGKICEKKWLQNPQSDIFVWNLELSNLEIIWNHHVSVPAVRFLHNIKINDAFRRCFCPPNSFVTPQWLPGWDHLVASERCKFSLLDGWGVNKNHNVRGDLWRKSPLICWKPFCKVDEFKLEKKVENKFQKQLLQHVFVFPPFLVFSRPTLCRKS